MKKGLLNVILLLVVQFAFARNFEIKSPNGEIKVSVNVDKTIFWSATLKDKEIIKKAEVNMDFSTGTDFGINPAVKSYNIQDASSMIYPVVPNKDAAIKDQYEQLTLRFRGDYTLNFRAYDDGVAYQFTDNGKKDRNVLSEKMALTFPNGSSSLFPEEKSMYSHNECFYLKKLLPNISKNEFCSLPVMFVTENGKVLFTETALCNYPGMFVRGNGNTTVDAIFPKFVLEAKDADIDSDRDQKITKEADYIAQVKGKREYPWRVFIISDDDRTFVESNLAFQLAKPLAIKDTEWIKPGKVAWDWYNANNISGVDFKAGLNTATYKYYIDFAAANKIEYVILDEGWTKTTTDILHFNPDMDIHELIRYGKEKGVGIILWVLWKPLDANMDEILDAYKSWGAKGIKVDFIQRNDQYVVKSYEHIAQECAKRQLLVDFHGAFKPSGLRRMYPNIINYEGVRGNENNKWSKNITPGHNVTLPFIRMAAGPLDYTPGAMANAQEKNFAVCFDRPMSLGTRAQQVAMYVVYEAPLQMLCDSPTRYYKEQETVDFISQIPTTWDETKVLEGAVGNYIAVARRKGDKWYIGAMTDCTPRNLSLNFSFLGEGKYKMEVFKDGVNADRFAEDYKIDMVEVSNQSSINAQMSAGGGWAAILTKNGTN